MSQPDEQQNQGQPQPGHNDLGAELRELGQQLEQAIRGAVESERAKQLQRDVASGMKEIGAQVQTAIKAIHDNPRVQELAERGAHAVDKARESKAANDFQEALARGVAQLNDQLAAFVQRLRTEADTTTSTTPPVDTSLPVSTPPPTSTTPPASTTPPTGSMPSTGETTRLESDEK